MGEELKRINKFLSEAGYCSRREADKLIDAGRVTINGVVPEMGTKISKDDVVMVDGEEVTNTKTSFVYLAFNKPIGVFDFSTVSKFDFHSSNCSWEIILFSIANMANPPILINISASA